MGCVLLLRGIVCFHLSDAYDSLARSSHGVRRLSKLRICFLLVPSFRGRHLSFVITMPRCHAATPIRPARAKLSVERASVRACVFTNACMWILYFKVISPQKYYMLGFVYAYLCMPIACLPACLPPRNIGFICIYIYIFTKQDVEDEGWMRNGTWIFRWEYCIVAVMRECASYVGGNGKLANIRYFDTKKKKHI